MAWIRPVVDHIFLVDRGGVPMVHLSRGLPTGADPDVAGVIALGYPLHPRFRPEVLNPPEWPFLVKPALFVQGDRDPFCDLERLRSEIPKLKEPADLVVIQRAGHSFEPIGMKRDTFPEVQDAMMDWIRGHIPSPDGRSVAR